MLTRPLAIVLIAVSLGLASPGGVLFRCRFDGVVRTACCCEHEQSTHEHPAMTQVMACRCCELLVRSPVTREPMKVDPPVRPVEIQFVVLKMTTPEPASSVTVSTPQVWWTGPPRPGGPLFLQSCSLLV